MKAAPVLQVAALAVAGGLAGFLAYHQFVAAPPALRPLPRAPTAASPAASPLSSPASAARAIPRQVPDIRLPDMAGVWHRLREAHGHARLYNFWASWCEPCRREIPLLNALQARHGAEGLEVVGIAIDFRDAIRAFTHRTPLSYALLVGEDHGLDAAARFGMDPVLPFSVFADEQNRIVALKVGELHGDEAEAILERMGALRAGRISLAKAQADISLTLKSMNVAARSR